MAELKSENSYTISLSPEEFRLISKALRFAGCFKLDNRAEPAFIITAPLSEIRPPKDEAGAMRLLQDSLWKQRRKTLENYLATIPKD